MSTFLGTDKCGKDYCIRTMISNSGKEGQYCYLDIQNQIQHYISSEYYSSGEIKIFANVDGVQIFDSKKESYWPISVKMFNKKGKFLLLFCFMARQNQNRLMSS